MTRCGKRKSKTKQTSSESSPIMKEDENNAALPFNLPIDPPKTEPSETNMSGGPPSLIREKKRLASDISDHDGEDTALATGLPSQSQSTETAPAHDQKRQRMSDDSGPAVSAHGTSGILFGLSSRLSSSSAAPGGKTAIAMVNKDDFNTATYIKEIKKTLPSLRSQYTAVRNANSFLEGVTGMTRNRVAVLEKRLTATEVGLAAVENDHAVHKDDHELRDLWQTTKIQALEQKSEDLEMLCRLVQ